MFNTMFGAKRNDEVLLNVVVRAPWSTQVQGPQVSTDPRRRTPSIRSGCSSFLFNDVNVLLDLRVIAYLFQDREKLRSDCSRDSRTTERLRWHSSSLTRTELEEVHPSTPICRKSEPLRYALITVTSS